MLLSFENIKKTLPMRKKKESCRKAFSEQILLYIEKESIIKVLTKCCPILTVKVILVDTDNS